MRVLVTGASGQLGAYLLRQLAGDRIDVVAWSGSSRGELFGVPLRPIDVARPDEIAAAFQDARPDVVVHCAAMGRVDACHADPGTAKQVNADGARWLAHWTTECGARLIYVSTDLVFDGQQGNYREQDAARPLSCYGRSKLAGEECVISQPNSLVVRLSLLFGRSLIGKPTYFDQQSDSLLAGKSVSLFVDEWRSPLSLPTAAAALAALASSKATGLLHLGGPQRLTRWEMGAALAKVLGSDRDLVQQVRQSDASFPEPRPRDVSLDSARWRTLFPHMSWPSFAEAAQELVG